MILVAVYPRVMVLSQVCVLVMACSLSPEVSPLEWHNFYLFVNLVCIFWPYCYFHGTLIILSVVPYVLNSVMTHDVRQSVTTLLPPSLPLTYPPTPPLVCALQPATMPLSADQLQSGLQVQHCTSQQPAPIGRSRHRHSCGGAVSSSTPPCLSGASSCSSGSGHALQPERLQNLFRVSSAPMPPPHAPPPRAPLQARQSASPQLQQYLAGAGMLEFAAAAAANSSSRVGGGGGAYPFTQQQQGGYGSQQSQMQAALMMGAAGTHQQEQQARAYAEYSQQQAVCFQQQQQAAVCEQLMLCQQQQAEEMQVQAQLQELLRGLYMG